MKKQLIVALAAAGLIAGVGSAAHAATTAANFNVTAALTSVCTFTSAANMAFTYTAFQAGTSSASTDLDFTCTRNVTISNVAFDTGTDKTSVAGASTATGAGVVAGLQYTLSTVAAALQTTGAAATTGSIGSADVRRIVVNGTMAGLQAGDASAATTQARTLTITY